MIEKFKPHNRPTDNMQNLCFAAQHVGEHSEVWLWRQMVGFKRVRPYVLTWKYLNSETFKPNEVSVHILPFYPRPAEKKGISRWIFRLRSLPSANFYGARGQELKAIERWFSDIRPKVILCHTGHVALKILPIAQRFDVPLIAHFHGADLSSSLQNRWYRWSLLHALRHFSAIVVVGKHQKRWMIAHNIARERIHVIPCGVPTDFFSCMPHDRKSATNRNIRFIAIGRLFETKGLHYTIRAFYKVLRSLPRAKLTIVGDGPARPNLELLARQLNLTSKINFIGFVTPNVVKRKLHESHVFVQHSIVREGWGVTIAEAAASGLPVVATRCGGIKDQVVDGRTGFLVEQLDVDRMADCMLKLARDAKLREQFGKAGRERMVREFDTEKQIAKLENVLLSFLVSD